MADDRIGGSNGVVFTNVRIIDGSGEYPYSGEVVVQGNRIRQVTKGASRLSHSPGAGGQTVIDGMGATLMPELFPTGVRYTGASLGFQVGAALSGGFSPLILASIFGSTGGTTWISVYLVALACITLVATLTVKETAHAALK